MKSIKNHLSLVVALVSILFSLQIYIVAERSIDAYKETLATKYSVVAVSEKAVTQKEFNKIDKIIAEVEELDPDRIIEKLSEGISQKNKDLLKVTLPKFYKIHLTHYPSPSEIESLTKSLLRYPSIKKVEDFSHTHDTTYKLLVLFKGVVLVFALSIFVVTTLLIFKELRIWQFKHSERMNIMGLFGAAVWLRSAVLFRLAFVDAVIATIITYAFFTYMASYPAMLEQFSMIGIEIVVFDQLKDLTRLAVVAIGLSTLLATMIVIGHREEV